MTDAHTHVFLGHDHQRNARATRVVIWITLGMMVVEIGAGWAYGSLALLADGVHMATHAGALGIAALAYGFAGRHAGDAAYTFGTGKVGALGAFASALVLGVVAIWIVAECVGRLAAPVPIQFGEAIWVAVLGLGVNLACAWALWGGAHDHGHDHDHDHGHDHGAAVGGDENLRAAFVHVVADALTSVLAIAGLAGGLLLGWPWLDGAVGLIGAVVIGHWSVGMLRQAAATLLDRLPDPDLAEAIRGVLQADGTEVVDLHLWRLGPGHLGLVVALQSRDPQTPAHYKARLAHLPQLSHVTVEVNPLAAG